jgi:hypothetical protein
MQTLNAWDLPEKQRQREWFQPVKWAAAALLVVGLGFGWGRWSAPSPDIKSLRAEIENSLRADLSRDLREQISTALASHEQQLTNNLRSHLIGEMRSVTAEALSLSANQNQQFLAAYHQKRQEEYQALLTDLSRFYERLNKLTSDHALLRREVETVALLTENGLRNTHQQLVQLATVTDPTGQQ